MGNNRITLVLVDTCAYRDANSDFPGIIKRLLPSFFSTLKEKGIVLLTHPVLENEICKHIEDSGLFKDYQALVTQLNRCNETLMYLQCCDDKLFSKICEIDIKEQIVESYRQHYHDAICLDYGNPAEVFEDYFKGNPPFAVSGKKKNEFPDAFVFNATKEFLEKHPNDVLLIVSKDNDWKSAFGELDNIIYCESISDALTRISSIDSILSDEMMKQIFAGAYKEIVTVAQYYTECECFELEDYETINELEIESCIIENIDSSFVPLEIRRDSLLISTNIILKVTGYAEVLDEENSIWDSIDQEYIYISYADIDFADAEVEVECEVLISFDIDDPEDTAQVTSFKLLNQGNICINCKTATVTQIDEDEMAIRVLREDMGYSRRRK